MNDRLKELFQELGVAINDSLSDSDRIVEAIAEIKRSGHDVFLVLEATICFRKAAEDEETEPHPKSAEEPSANGPVQIKWSTQDAKFLKTLHISHQEEDT